LRSFSVFYSLYGDKAVLASSENKINQLASAKGFSIISLPFILKVFGIKTAEDVITKVDELTEIENIPQKFLDEAYEILDILDIPARVAFFSDFKDAPFGRAIEENGIATIWLNENLMLPGKKIKRYGTIAKTFRKTYEEVTIYLAHKSQPSFLVGKNKLLA